MFPFPPEFDSPENVIHGTAANRGPARRIEAQRRAEHGSPLAGRAYPVVVEQNRQSMMLSQSTSSSAKPAERSHSSQGLYPTNEYHAGRTRREAGGRG